MVNGREKYQKIREIIWRLKDEVSKSKQKNHKAWDIISRFIMCMFNLKIRDWSMKHVRKILARIYPNLINNKFRN